MCRPFRLVELMLENGIPSILVSTILTYSTESYNIMGNEYRILLYIEYYNIVLTYSQSTKSIIFYTHSPRLLFPLLQLQRKIRAFPKPPAPSRQVTGHTALFPALAQHAADLRLREAAAGAGEEDPSGTAITARAEALREVGQEVPGGSEA